MILSFIDCLKYRSRADISAMILETANGGTTKTRKNVQGFSLLCSIKKYLTLLQENTLIEYKEEAQIYKPTDKGIHFLYIYNQVGELIPISNSLKN